MGDGQRKAGGDGSVDGVAAAGEYRGTGIARRRRHAHDQAGGGRHTGRRFSLPLKGETDCANSGENEEDKSSRHKDCKFTLGSDEVAGPRGETLLLWGWLRARLRRELELEHEPAGEVELVAIDGEDVPTPRAKRTSSSDLLSDQLEIFARDRIYEEAVSALAAVPA